MAGELKALDIVLARYKAQNTAFRMKKKEEASTTLLQNARLSIENMIL